MDDLFRRFQRTSVRFATVDFQTCRRSFAVLDEDFRLMFMILIYHELKIIICKISDTHLGGVSLWFSIYQLKNGYSSV